MKHARLFWIVIFIIGMSVRSTHLFQAINTNSWREADVSLIAKNFYLHGTDIFHPQIGYDGSGPGFVESEFQIYSYLIAVSYKIFGFWEPTGRIISFLFSLATMLVFFKFSRYLLDTKAAMAASLVFSLSPILMVISVAIQPESVMFFFYISSAYTFVRWLDSGSKKYYLPAIIFTALALLCKITAANIGILFLLLIIIRKDWKFLFKPKVVVLGVLSILPSILWYSYGHRFYVLYGNSLGLSNEDPWIGWDFFTSRHLITGLVKLELFNVWTIPGPLIIALALVFTKVIKKESFLFGIYWLASASVFYIITSRTTAEDWAWYYHIFSIPAVSILLGSSVIELSNKYFPHLNFKKKIIINKAVIVKSRAIIFFLVFSVFCFMGSSFIYLVKTKPVVYQTSKYYNCIDSLKKIIPQNSLFLTNGGYSKDKLGYSLAIDIGYFFYWLDRKGYSISIEDLSLKNIVSFKARGVTYFLIEERILEDRPGLGNELKRNLTMVFECNGCILFKL
jgi:Dolichyl-phosphate-mannose-protein mannosyltransferase